MADMRMTDAPGCVGSSMIRLDDHPICRTCAFTSICAKMAKVSAARMEVELRAIRKNTRGRTGRKTPAPVEETPAPQAATRPKEHSLTPKGAAIWRALELQNLDAARLRSSLGSDGFDVLTATIRPDYVRSALREISRGETSRRRIVEEISNTTGAPVLKAHGYAGMVLNAMLAKGIVIEMNGMIRRKTL